MAIPKEPTIDEYMNKNNGGEMAFLRAHEAWKNQALSAPPPAPNYAQAGGGGSPYTFPKTYEDQPDMPSYQQGYNSSMALSPGLDAELSQDNIDPSGINAFSGEALRQGPSKWAGRANEEQNHLAMEARDRAAGDTAGQTASARAQLASRGGLSSGAAERLAQGGANNFLSMTQEIGNTAAKNRMQIGMNDEQNRMSMLGQLPGMQQQQAQFGLDKTKLGMAGKQYDTNNQIQENQNMNNWNLGMADIAGQQYGATKTALAQRNEGK